MLTDKTETHRQPVNINYVYDLSDHRISALFEYSCIIFVHAKQLKHTDIIFEVWLVGMVTLGSSTSKRGSQRNRVTGFNSIFLINEVLMHGMTLHKEY